MAPAAAYYLVTIVALVNGQITVETKDTKFPTELACVKAAATAQLIEGDATKLYRCDPGGPDIPTQMELEAGE